MHHKPKPLPTTNVKRSRVTVQVGVVLHGHVLELEQDGAPVVIYLPTRSQFVSDEITSYMCL